MITATFKPSQRLTFLVQIQVKRLGDITTHGLKFTPNVSTEGYDVEGEPEAVMSLIGDLAGTGTLVRVI